MAVYSEGAAKVKREIEKWKKRRRRRMMMMMMMMMKSSCTET